MSSAATRPPGADQASPFAGVNAPRSRHSLHATVQRVLQPRWPIAFAGALLLLGLAGFSGSSWWAGARHSPLLDLAQRESSPEVLGTSRSIRTDEWAVDLPTARSQQLAEPSFPLVNLRQGLGQLQRTPDDSPVLDWGIPFRPLIWPLLFGTKWSHGVRWFWRSALLFVGLYTVLRALLLRAGLDEAGRQRRGSIAALCALAIFSTSAFTWWLSSVLPEAALLACFTVAAIGRAAREAHRPRRLAWHAATAYFAACTFFVFYPPAWAPLLIICSAAALDLHRDARSAAAPRSGAALASLAAIGFGVVLAVAYYVPFVAVITQTVYPARRMAEAGGLPPWRLLDLVWPSLRVYAPLNDPSATLGLGKLNECEASAVEALPFFVCAGLAAVSPRVRAGLRRALAAHRASFTAWAVLFAWLLFPLPAWFGRITFLSLSPWYRAWFVFGLSTAFLASILVAELDEPSLPAARPILEVVSAAILLSGLLALAVLRVPSPGLEAADRWNHLAPIVLAAIAAIASVVQLRTAWGPFILVSAWAFPLLIADWAVHPLTRSRDLFARGSGHAVVERGLLAQPGRVLDYTTHIANSLAGYGWPVLSSVQFAPDTGMFRFLAPDSPGLRDEIFNRYALLQFRPPPGRAENPAEDAVRLFVSPCSSRLAALGVNHFLAYPEDRLPAECADQFVVQAAGEIQLWSRKDAVCEFGVARAAAFPKTALDYDFSCRAGGARARLVPHRSSAVVELPAERGIYYALPMNLSLVDEIRCEHATASLGEAHLFFTTDGTQATCQVDFLGTRGGLRRLLRSRRGQTDPAPAGFGQ